MLNPEEYLSTVRSRLLEMADGITIQMGLCALRNSSSAEVPTSSHTPSAGVGGDGLAPGTTGLTEALVAALTQHMTRALLDWFPGRDRGVYVPEVIHAALCCFDFSRFATGGNDTPAPRSDVQPVPSHGESSEATLSAERSALTLTMPRTDWNVLLHMVDAQASGTFAKWSATLADSDREKWEDVRLWSLRLMGLLHG